MKKEILIFFLVFSLDTIVPTRAHAYVDPGVAGMLYQIVIIVLVGIGTFFVSFKNAIVRFFKRIWGYIIPKKST